jgi:hypothetical protein
MDGNGGYHSGILLFFQSLFVILYGSAEVSAKKDDQAVQVDPEHKGDDCAKRTVDQTVLGPPTALYVPAEYRAGYFNRDRGNQCSPKGGFPGDQGVGNPAIYPQKDKECE